MTIYTGYVYLWYDTKAKLFYLGGHKGKVEDSYICSNHMMLRAYKKRPTTFKLKILEYVYGDTGSLREAEQRWLNMIKDSELYWTSNIYNKTVRYYNKKKIHLEVMDRPIKETLILEVTTKARNILIQKKLKS